MQYKVTYSEDYLEHHGILGQKWGVRRFQNADGSYTAAGKERYSSTAKETSIEAIINEHNTKVKSTSNEMHNNEKDDNRSARLELGKTIATIPISLAAGGLGFLTGSPSMMLMGAIGTVGATALLVDAGASYMKEKKYEKEKESEEIDQKTGLKLKADSLTVKEDAKRVNPGFANFNNNTKNNCVLCSVTYDLRRRGYDASANKASLGYDTQSILDKYYPGAKLTKLVPSGDEKEYSLKDSYSSKVEKDLTSALKSQGDGARGIITFRWNEGGGHAIAYEVTGEDVSFVDAQNSYVAKNEEVSYYTNRVRSNYINYARLDNIELSTKDIQEVAH